MRGCWARKRGAEGAYDPKNKRRKKAVVEDEEDDEDEEEEGLEYGEEESEDGAQGGWSEDEEETREQAVGLTSFSFFCFALFGMYLLSLSGFDQGFLPSR